MNLFDKWIDGSVYQFMTWEDVRDQAALDTPIVIPVGTTEQHGPHLPLATDWILPTEIARRAREIRPLVVGPTVTIGYRSRPSSGGGQHFPGTIALKATTFMATVEDVLNELVRMGFKNLVLYNWHYENQNFVYESCALVSERHPHVKIVVVEDALKFVPDLPAKELELLWPGGFPGLDLEHAAIIETALWLYFEPNAVRTDRMVQDAPLRHPPYDILPIDLSLTTASGSLSDPTSATAEKGELLAKRIVDHLVDIVNAEFPAA